MLHGIFSFIRISKLNVRVTASIVWVQTVHGELHSLYSAVCRKYLLNVVLANIQGQPADVNASWTRWRRTFPLLPGW